MYDGQIEEVNLCIFFGNIVSISLTGVIQIKVQVKNVFLSASVPLNSKSISFAILQL